MTPVLFKAFRSCQILTIGIICIGTTTFLSGCSSKTNTTKAPKIIPIIKVPVQKVSTQDGTVAYRVSGSGPNLVLIMGFEGSIDAWYPPFIDNLAHNFRVYTPDNAGVGQTSPIPSSDDTIPAMAVQINAFINALKIKKPDILGWSMGGMIAQALAVLYPQDVNRLILCATIPGNGNETLPQPASLTNLAEDLFPSDQQHFARIYLNEIAKYPGFHIATGSTISFQQGALLKWVLGEDKIGHEIDTIKAKTLIADGSEDPLIPIQNDYELHDVIKGSQLKIYNDAAHGFLFQDEDSFLPIIKKFLSS